MAFGVPQIAACFPRNRNGRELLFMHSYVVREFEKLIHGAQADTTKARRFQRAQFGSKIGSDDARIKWCQALGFKGDGCHQHPLPECGEEASGHFRGPW